MVQRLFLILLLCGSCVAQTVAVHAGHLIDPANGTVANDQVILIRDGKITAVGAQVAIPADATVVDLSKQWVLPGLVDAHTHITDNGPVNPSNGSLSEHRLDTESSGFRTALGLHNAELLLNAGFLALRDVGNNMNYTDIAVDQAIKTGWFKGPTMICSGKIISPFGGQSHGYSPEVGPLWHDEYIDADTPDELRKAIHENIYYGATVIKLVTDNSPFFYSEEDIRVAAEEAHRAGRKLAVHVYGGPAADAVIAGGADSLEHGFDLTDDQLRAMKAKGMYLVGTDFPIEHLIAFGGMVPQLAAQATADKTIKRLASANRIGVKMAFGSDVVVELPGENRADMVFDFLKVWQKAGVPPAAILRAWTTNGYDLLGIDKQQGAIAAGLAGDMIAVPENPLENIEILRKVDFVMKDGQVIRHP
jgi:imidazolonepropionase-like amidohydrolase